MNLKDRVAVVSGGARGIGRAIEEDLSRNGASVVIVDSGVSISGEPLQEKLAEEVAAGIERAAAVCGDIADETVARKAIELAQSRFGAIDIVVNNAAILRDNFIFKSEAAAWDAVLRTNLTGAQRLLAAATPEMRDQAKSARAPGAIVNIVPSTAFDRNVRHAAESSTNAALLHHTPSAA